MKRSTKKRLEQKEKVRVALLRKLVFSKFYSQKDLTLQKAKDIIRPHLGLIAAQAKYLEATDYYGGDNRSPLDTYGYNDEESIISNLFYISDRFNAQFRLDWTIGILDENLNKL